jgi:hypothetical protein
MERVRLVKGNDDDDEVHNEKNIDYILGAKMILITYTI